MKHKEEFWRDVQVADYFGVCRATVWNWVHRGVMPPPVQLGPKLTRWRRSQIVGLRLPAGLRGS